MNNLLAGSPDINSSNYVTNPVLGNLGNMSAASFLQGSLSGLISLGFILGTIVFFFMIVVGAVKWIASSGDKAALESAKGTITNAIIGIVILFSLFAIINLIDVFFNIKIMTLDIGSLVIQ